MDNGVRWSAGLDTPLPVFSYSLFGNDAVRPTVVHKLSLKPRVFCGIAAQEARNLCVSLSAVLVGVKLVVVHRIVFVSGEPARGEDAPT